MSSYQRFDNDEEDNLPLEETNPVTNIEVRSTKETNNATLLR